MLKTQICVTRPQCVKESGKGLKPLHTWLWWFCHRCQMSNSSDLRVSFLHIGEIPEQIVVHIYGYLIVLCRQCINTGNWCFAQNCIIWNLKISFVIFFVLTPYVLVGECQCSGLWRQRRYVPLKWWSWRQHDPEVEPEHCGRKAYYHIYRNMKKAQGFITQYIIQLLAGGTINNWLLLCDVPRTNFGPYTPWSGR